METPKIDWFTRLNGIPMTCTIVCDMVFEKSNHSSIVKLEIEGKPEIVDQVMKLLYLTFSLRINFHGGVGYARFTEEKTLTPENINIIHFRVFDIEKIRVLDFEKIKKRGIVLDGSIIHVTLSPRTLSSSSRWVRRLKVDSDYDSDEDSNDDLDG